MTASRRSLVCVDPRQIDVSHCGSEFDARAARTRCPATADPCGERGEFHTFVYDGPMFDQPNRDSTWRCRRARRVCILRPLAGDAHAQVRSERSRDGMHVPSKLVSSPKPTPTDHSFLHRMRVALLLLIPLAGCLDAATGNVANIPAPTASVPGESGLRARVLDGADGADAVDRKSGDDHSDVCSGSSGAQAAARQHARVPPERLQSRRRRTSPRRTSTAPVTRALPWSRCSPGRRSRTSTSRCAAPAC